MGDINHWRRNISNYKYGHPPPSIATSESSQLSIPGSESELALSPTHGSQDQSTFQSGSKNSTLKVPSIPASSSKGSPRRSSASGQSSHSGSSADWPGYNNSEPIPPANPWQMSETILIKLMSQSLQDCLPAHYNSRLLHVLEAFRDQQKMISSLQESYETETTARQEDLLAFQKAGRLWEEESAQWEAEVKRLELVIARGPQGLEGVIQARSGSIIRRRAKKVENNTQDQPNPTGSKPAKDVFSRLAPSLLAQLDASSTSESTKPLSEDNVTCLEQLEGKPPNFPGHIPEPTKSDRLPNFHKAPTADHEKFRSHKRRDFSFGAGDDAILLSRQNRKAELKDELLPSAALHKVNTNAEPLSKWQFYLNDKEIRESPHEKSDSLRRKRLDLAGLGPEKLPARENSSSSVATVKLRPQRKTDASYRASHEGNQSSETTAIAAARAAAQGSRDSPNPRLGESK